MFIIAAPAEFNRDFLGEPTIKPDPLDPGSAKVALKCEVPVKDSVRSWKNVTYQISWYSEGKHLKTDNICGGYPAPSTGSPTIIPDFDTPCRKGKPLLLSLIHI